MISDPYHAVGFSSPVALPSLTNKLAACIAIPAIACRAVSNAHILYGRLGFSLFRLIRVDDSASDARSNCVRSAKGVNKDILVRGGVGAVEESPMIYVMKG